MGWDEMRCVWKHEDTTRVGEYSSFRIQCQQNVYVLCATMVTINCSHVRVCHDRAEAGAKHKCTLLQSRSRMMRCVLCAMMRNWSDVRVGRKWGERKETANKTIYSILFYSNLFYSIRIDSDEPIRDAWAVRFASVRLGMSSLKWEWELKRDCTFAIWRTTMACLTRSMIFCTQHI